MDGQLERMPIVSEPFQVGEYSVRSLVAALRPDLEQLSADECYMGTIEILRSCGFLEIARRSPHRPVRLELRSAA